MWTDWKRKIKDFADDITSPQFEEEEEGDDREGRDHDEREDEPIRLPYVEPTSSTSPGASRTSGAAAERQGVLGDSEDDPSRRLEYTVERRVVPPPATQQPQARVDPHEQLQHVPAASPAEPQLSSVAAASPKAAPPSPARALATSSSSSADKAQEKITSLEARIEELAAEKADMDARVAAYQEQVRATHEQTVAYYEERQSQREAELTASAAETAKALQRDLDAYRQRAEAAEAANASAAARVDELEHALASAKAAVSALQAAPPSHSADARDDVAAENEQLRRNLADLKAQLAARPPAAAEEPQAVPQQASAAELEEAVATIQRLETNTQTWRAQVEDAQARCAEWEQKFAALESAKDALQQRAQREVQVAEASVVELQAQLNETAQRLATVEAARDAAETETAAQAAENDASTTQVTATQAAELAHLTSRLDATEHRAQDAEQALQSVRNECATLRDTTTRSVEAARAALTKEWEARLATALAEKQVLQNRLEAAQCEADALARAREDDKTRLVAAGDASLAQLRDMNRQLETDAQHQDTLMRQLESTVEAALKHADVDLPQRGRGGGGRYSFSDLLTVLTSEFARVVDEQDKAEQILQEWEQTYEQAKEVNESLNAQLNEAWRTSGTVQEALSTAESELEHTQRRVQELESRLGQCERELMEERRVRQELSDEKSNWVRRISESETDVAGHQEALQALQREVEASHTLLNQREEELVVARRSVDNLQLALESFKQNRTRDVEERTMDLQSEIDELRVQLSEAERGGGSGGGSPGGGSGGGADGRQRDQLVRELAAKSLEVTDLHGKLQELRRMLEDTARQLSGETMIDKGVASHLMVSYIHALISQRKEADEMLKVMSGLLAWDDEMQERAGLLPGPLNPHPPETKGRRGFLSFGRRGPATNTTNTNTNSTAARGGNKPGQKKPSLASLWVDFLMKESTGQSAKETDRVEPASAASTTRAPAVIVEEVIEDDKAAPPAHQ